VCKRCTHSNTLILSPSGRENDSEIPLIIESKLRRTRSVGIKGLVGFW